MRRGRSTGTPTKDEAARIEAAKVGPCIACLVRAEEGDMPADLIVYGCDYHHAKSGNIRVGHAAGFAMCLWHHRGHPWGQWTTKQLREFYGPSLMDGSALFRRTYGPDSFLILRQTQVIEGTDDTNRINRSSAA